MRLLLPVGDADDVTEEGLERLYAFGSGSTLRSNFVTTLDGAATGGDGLSGSINNAADKRVFDLQRRLCDAVLVGAGTARAEGYRRIAPPGGGPAPLLVVVSDSARVPPLLAADDPERGEVVLVTRATAGAPAIEAARAELGADAVWVLGGERVDLVALLGRLADAGRPRVLCEGGPTLHTTLLAADLVDELALTVVPAVVGGDGPRITAGGPLEGRFGLSHLLGEDSTLLGLWKREDRRA